MAHSSQTYATRADAIADLDASTAPRARAARALLDATELATNAHAASGPVIVTVQDVPRPDGGTALQCVVQQLAASPALPAVDVHASGDATV